MSHEQSGLDFKFYKANQFTKIGLKIRNSLNPQDSNFK